MLTRLKAAGLMGALALAALVPLYGDPRTAPVTHAEWARMLLRALQMDEVLPASGLASQAFETLSWKNSLSFGGDRYLRASGVQVVGEGRDRRVVASEEEGDVVYPFAVVRGGDYTLRLRIAGNPASPASAQITAVGASALVKAFQVAPSSLSGWLDAGSAHLDPGAYTVSVALPQGTSIDRVEVRPPCVGSVEPPGGWKPTAVVQGTDVVVTALKALDLESELPPAAASIEIAGADFQAPGAGALVSAAKAGGGPQSLWLKAGPAGLQAVVFADVPEAGLYSVDTYGIQGGGQSWLADACRKAVVCGTQTAGGPSATPEWRHVMTAELTAGRHFFSVTLGPGAAIERLRLERKKVSPDDYLATLKRLGFDVGAPGPVARSKAVDAMRFIQGLRTTTFSPPCGDPLATTNTLVAQAGAPGAAAPGPVAPGVTSPPPGPGAGAGAGPPPLSPGAIPPQVPASPTTP